MSSVSPRTSSAAATRWRETSNSPTGPLGRKGGDHLFLQLAPGGGGGQLVEGGGYGTIVFDANVSQYGLHEHAPLAGEFVPESPDGEDPPNKDPNFWIEVCPGVIRNEEGHRG